MQTIAFRSRSHAAVLLTLFAVAALLLASCAGGSGKPTSAVDLAPFKKLARTGSSSTAV